MLIPLFPLPLVLLPSTAVPLHIFEERYKLLVNEVLEPKAEFGIVLAKDGGVVSIGCTAIVQRVIRRYDDGRMDIVVEGRRRFRIEELNEEKQYLQASFDWFEDVPGQDSDAALRFEAEHASAILRRLNAPDVMVELDDTSPQYSFQLAQFIDDIDTRQTLLSMRSEAERLRFLITILPALTSKMERVEQARRLAPTNGHAKHL